MKELGNEGKLTFLFPWDFFVLSNLWASLLREVSSSWRCLWLLFSDHSSAGREHHSMPDWRN